MDQATSAADVFLTRELGEAWNQCTGFYEFRQPTEESAVVQISVQLCSLEGEVEVNFNRLEEGWYLTGVSALPGSSASLRNAVGRMSISKIPVEDLEFSP